MDLDQTSDTLNSDIQNDASELQALSQAQTQTENADQPEIPENWLRNYLTMGIGQIISWLGSALVQFALVWYITKTTGSAISLLGATLTGTLPRVILGPFAGALVDRWNRKMTMIVSDGVIALATLLLAILFHTGHIQIWHIYVMLFVRSVGGIFQSPAMSASTTLMVPKAQYTRLGGISQAADGIITIVSPPLGALLISFLPIQAVLAVDTITATIAILLLVFFVKVPQPGKRPGDELGVSLKTVVYDVRDGLRYVFSWKGVLMLLMGGTLINMASTPAFSLLPLHVEQFFQKGADGLAWLHSAFGIGSIVGGLVLGVWGGFKRKVFTVLMGILGMGVGMLSIGLLPASAFGVAIGLMVSLGLASAFANGPLGAIMQEKIPPELQGRVFTVMSSLIQATVPIGLLIAAPIAHWLGVQAWFLIGGIVCLLMGILGFIIKPMATLDFQGPGGVILPEYADRVKR